MGCQADVRLGKTLVFSVCTHDPDTGVLTDADAVPEYRIYEDETAVAILNGNMAKLDDANTTGFYTESITCSAANGFEADKTYTVYISATVDSDTGGICYGFRCYDPWAASTRTLTTATGAAYTANNGGELTIHRGDTMSVSFTDLGDISTRTKLWFAVKEDKSQTDAQSLIMIEESAGLMYLNGADASARAANGTITVTDAAAGDITVALDETETDDLALASGLSYDVQVLTAAGVVSTLTEDEAQVTADVTRLVA